MIGNMRTTSPNGFTTMVSRVARRRLDSLTLIVALVCIALIGLLH